MATLFDDASLVMIPSGYKDDKLYSIKPTSGAGDFTFSRDGSGASPATRVNSAGLIEKGRTNELTYSNDFSNAAWSKSSSITFTSGQSGYDGTNNGWSAIPPASAGNSAFYQSNISNLATTSVYAKYNGYHLRIRVGGTGGNRAYATFDLQNGTIGNSGGSAFVNANIELIGSGWYRCSLTKNYSTAGFAEFQISENATDGDNPSWTPNGTDGIYIQDAQLEKGLVATSYIETTTAAASAGILGDMPRLDYSGGATCPSLLLEPARTNLIANSEFYGSGSGWNKIQSSVTINDATSPEGVDNAAKLLASASTANHQVDSPSHSIVSGAVTGSVFAKKGSVNFVRLRFSDLTTNVRGWFDLENGEVGTIDSGAVGSIVDMGNGWYKCILTATGNTNTTSANTLQIFVQESDAQTSWTADGDEYIHIYGAQVEQGSYPTSYVPSYGSATARAGDSCSKTGISSLIGQTEGTLFIDFIRPANALIANQVIYGITDTGSQNRLRILTTGSDAVRVLFQTNGNQIEYDVNLSFTLTPDNTPIKLAVGYKSGDIACYVNGNQADTSSNSITITTSIENIEINSTPNSNVVSQALLFDTRLTNAELAALTTL